MGSKKAIYGYIAAVAFICWFMLDGFMGRPASKMIKYENSKYGFSLIHPSSWTVADTKDAARREKALEDDSSSFLIGIADFEVFSVAYIDGSWTRGRLSVKFGPYPPNVYLGKSMMSIADNMDDVGLNVTEQIHTEVLHGTSYEVAAYELNINEVKVKSKVFATEVEGGALLFGLTAVEPRYLESLENLFRTVRFAAPKSEGESAGG